MSEDSRQEKRTVRQLLLIGGIVTVIAAASLPFFLRGTERRVYTPREAGLRDIFWAQSYYREAHKADPPALDDLEGVPIPGPAKGRSFSVAELYRHDQSARYTLVSPESLARRAPTDIVAYVQDEDGQIAVVYANGIVKRLEPDVLRRKLAEQHEAGPTSGERKR
jgi:hypothetical protein